MQCPKAYFVRVLVLSEIYVNSFSNYHVIKEKKDCTFKIPQRLQQNDFKT